MLLSGLKFANVIDAGTKLALEFLPATLILRAGLSDESSLLTDMSGFSRDAVLTASMKFFSFDVYPLFSFSLSFLFSLFRVK